MAWSPTATATADVPMDARMDPPTFEEIEAMDKEERLKEAEICETPSASDISVNSKHPPPPYSRQVSRVSGTGRATLQLASKGALVPKSKLAREAAERKRGASPRGRLMNQAPAAAPVIEQGARTQPRSNLSRRSISADDMDRRLMSRVHRQDGLQRGPNDMDARRAMKKAGGQHARQRAPPGEGPASTQGLQKSNGNPRNTRPRGGQRDARGTAARRAPYAAQGTPSASKDNDNKPKRPERKQSFVTPVGVVNGYDGAADSAGGVVPPKLRRRNSAPSMSDVAQEFEIAEQVESSQVESEHGSETCWGGGLPPIRNAIAQGPSGARAMAARAPPTTERFPDRYPANDRESFARTLNDEELDEVWQGLGDGVSQRGCGSEVAFECAPSSPGRAVGKFPMLTANVLERHDQLAVSGGGVLAAERPPNVMPMPKDIGDKAVHDMENGTPSSKKISGSFRTEEASLLATVVSYGMLVLWMSHLVFNALLQ